MCKMSFSCNCRTSDKSMQCKGGSRTFERLGRSLRLSLCGLVMSTRGQLSGKTHTGSFELFELTDADIFPAEDRLHRSLWFYET